MGYILYFMNVPIAWKSKNQGHVSLSSCEAEYIAISELVKEVMFVRQIAEDMGTRLKTPIPIFVDNTGAIQMVINNVGTSGVRHVNVRYHYIRELHGDVVVMEFVKLEENEADMMTKNATKDEFGRHSIKWVAKVPGVLLQKVKNLEGC